jgi:hypothetical protein
MAAMKNVFTDIQILLEDSDNTPLMIARKLGIPVEWVFEVLEYSDIDSDNNF